MIKARMELVFQKNDYRLLLGVDQPDGKSAWLSGLSWKTIAHQEHDPEAVIEPRWPGVPVKDIVQAIVNAAAEVGIVASNSPGPELLKAKDDHLRDLGNVIGSLNLHVGGLIKAVSHGA
jgi:hypothetical protein